MAHTSLNIELDSRPDRNGFTVVMIRLHQTGQKPARIQTTVRVQDAARHWALLDKKRKNKKIWGNWVVRHPDADAINAKILSEYERIKKQIETWQKDELLHNPDLTESTLTPKALAERFKHKLSESYFDLAAKVIEASKTLAFRTYANRQSSVNSLAAFAGEDLPLQAVTVAYVEKFQTYLKDQYISPKTGKRLKASSINQYMEALNTVHVEILRLKGHTKSKAALLSPFTDVDKLVAKSTYRAKLDEESIASIQALELPVSKQRRMTPQDAFSIWVLSHLLAGMRFTDTLLIRYQNFQLDEKGEPVKLKYEMHKTGNVVNLPLFDEAKRLLKRWWRSDAKPTDFVLPYLESSESFAQYLTRDELVAAPFACRKRLDNCLHYWNGKINKCLLEIEKAAGLAEPLRMHNARHSFADLARRIMQQDGTLTLLDITQLLGQRDPRMVMVYIEEMEKQDSTRPMEAIFKRNLKKRKAKA